MSSRPPLTPPGGPGGSVGATGTDADSDATAAVTALYQAHAVGLIRLAIVMLGDRGAAEDVVQDAFLGLYRNWDRLDDHGNALTYVRSAVLNRCRNALRQRGQRERHDRQGPGPMASESAEAVALIGEEHQQVLAAIRALPDRQREALVLRSYLDLPEEEAARAMGISRGTVKSATSRAVAALGRKLKEGLMITTEDRARAAMQAIGNTVRDAPPLELPPGAPDLLAAAADEVQFGGHGARRLSLRPGGAVRPGSRGRYRRWRSKLAPIAAAVADAAVAIALVTIRDVPGVICAGGVHADGPPSTVGSGGGCTYKGRTSIGFLEETKDGKGGAPASLVDFEPECSAQAGDTDGAYIGWANADGSVVIGSQVWDGHVRFGLFRDGQFTPLPALPVSVPVPTGVLIGTYDW